MTPTGPTEQKHHEGQKEASLIPVASAHRTQSNQSRCSENVSTWNWGRAPFPFPWPGSILFVMHPEVPYQVRGWGVGINHPSLCTQSGGFGGRGDERWRLQLLIYYRSEGTDNKDRLITPDFVHEYLNIADSSCHCNYNFSGLHLQQPQFMVKNGPLYFTCPSADVRGCQPCNVLCISYIFFSRWRFKSSTMTYAFSLSPCQTALVPGHKLSFSL